MISQTIRASFQFPARLSVAGACLLSVWQASGSFSWMALACLVNVLMLLSPSTLRFAFFTCCLMGFSALIGVDSTLYTLAFLAPLLGRCMARGLELSFEAMEDLKEDRKSQESRYQERAGHGR